MRRPWCRSGEVREHGPDADPLPALARARRPGRRCSANHVRPSRSPSSTRRPSYGASAGASHGTAPSTGRMRVPETSEHASVRVGPAGLEPRVVDAPLPRPVVRVGRQVEVREAPRDARLAAVSTHIGAQPGEIAPVVLLPGDPQARAVDRRDVPRRRDAATPRCAACSASPVPGRATRSRCRGRGWASRRWRSTSTSCSTSTTCASIVRVGSCGGLSEQVAVRDVDHRLGRLHRLVDEPDHLRGPRLRAGRRLRPAARRGRRRGGRAT